MHHITSGEFDFKQRSDGVSNHHSHHSLHKRSFRYRSKEASKLHVTGLCAGNSPVTGKFPAQMASNAENVSIWWRYHEESLTKPLEPQVNMPPLWRNLYFAHGYLVDILYTGTRYIIGTSKCPDTNQRSDVLLDSVANRLFRWMHHSWKSSANHTTTNSLLNYMSNSNDCAFLFDNYIQGTHVTENTNILCTLLLRWSRIYIYILLNCGWRTQIKPYHGLEHNDMKENSAYSVIFMLSFEA